MAQWRTLTQKLRAGTAAVRRVLSKGGDLILGKYGRVLLNIVRVAAGVWIVFVLWFFWNAARSPIDYQVITESGEGGGVPAPEPRVCPGRPFEFEVRVHIRRAPAVVAITENWVSLEDSRKTILDQAPEWRIIPGPTNEVFAVRTNVPWGITEGRYEYRRALGLNAPSILRMNVTVAPPSACQGAAAGK
jgi:hypothetical protein